MVNAPPSKWMSHRRPTVILGCLVLLILIVFQPHTFGAQSNSDFGETPAAAVPAGTEAKPGADSSPAADDGGEFQDDFDFAEEQTPVSPIRIADPLEPVNRVLFQINDRLYFWLFKPAAQGYNLVMPEDFRLCISNFFSNVLTPVRLLNCMLQGKFKNAETEVARFFVNTTVGILGFGDPAKQVFNMDISDEDLGQTLGLWGFGHGFYIVWPVFGSSTLRESVGFFGDIWVNPIEYLEPAGATLGVGAYRRFNDLSFRIGEYEAIKAAAIEPYSAVRDGYIQFRNALVER